MTTECAVGFIDKVPTGRPHLEHQPVIVRYVIHLEANRGYWPRLSLRRMPRHGDRVTDGGQMGTLIRCPECGDGFLHRADPTPPPAVLPTES
jgi:hypothetical protein